MLYFSVNTIQDILPGWGTHPNECVCKSANLWQARDRKLHVSAHNLWLGLLWEQWCMVFLYNAPVGPGRINRVFLGPPGGSGWSDLRLKRCIRISLHLPHKPHSVMCKSAQSAKKYKVYRDTRLAAVRTPARRSGMLICSGLSLKPHAGLPVKTVKINKAIMSLEWNVEMCWNKWKTCYVPQVEEAQYELLSWHTCGISVGFFPENSNKTKSIH